jgi:glycosyltransferase involved in cell wall biosynthesis
MGSSVLEASFDAQQASVHADTRLDALYVLNALSVGGSEHKIVRLVNRLNERGLAAGIAYLNGPDTLESKLHRSVRRWHLERKGKFSFRALNRLVDVVLDVKPRVVFAVNLYPTLYVLGMRMRLADAAPEIAALVNTSEFPAGERWRKLLYERVLRRFDRVIYGCQAQRDLWLDRRSRAWARSSVVYNGVDLKEFNAKVRRIDAGARKRPFVIGNVGRLTPEKNQRVLIDALVSLRREGIDAKLLLVGEGPLRRALTVHARERGVEDAVEITGALADVRPALERMDVFLLPSTHIETFSNAALEAMAMGRPVVLSDIGGAREMIRDGIDGFVVPRSELESRLPTLLRELASDADRCSRLGEAARRRVESSFSFDRMVDRYVELIERVEHGQAG